MRNKKIIIIFLCLISFCLFLMFGAGFVNCFIPQIMPIYEDIYLVSGFGVIILGATLGVYLGVTKDE